MSGDIDDAFSEQDAELYRGALENISSGEYDPECVKLVREGVFKGYIGWREASRAALELIKNHPEVQKVADCLDDVAKGVAHAISVPYMLSYVEEGLLDKHAAHDLIEESTVLRTSIVRVTVPRIDSELWN